MRALLVQKIYHFLLINFLKVPRIDFCINTFKDKLVDDIDFFLFYGMGRQISY